MRVFVSEYFTGGASDEMSSGSICREGLAMLKAVTLDLGRLPDCSVVTTLHSNLSESFDCEVIRVDSVAAESCIFRQLINQVDAVLVIAPETGGILADRCRQVRSSPAISWNCTPDSIELCGDKLQLARHFEYHEIPTIPTQLADLDQCPQQGELPIVLKPKDGAGSTLTFRINNRLEWQQAIRTIQDQSAIREFVVQPYVEGRSLSAGTSLSLCGQHVQCLSIGEQRLSSDGRFGYCGGRIPAEVPAKVAETIQQTVLRACRTVSGLAGYVGFDLILAPDGAISIVEINPRLTTSYVGYRKLYPDPIPGQWLSPGMSLSAQKSPRPIEFSVFEPMIS